MNFFKFVWKNISTRIWLLVTAPLLIFILVVSLLMTQVPFFRGTFDLLWGGERAIVVGSRGMFTTDDGLETSADVLAAANALNEEIAAEGMILLKNDNAALPLKATEKKVTVFGKNSVRLVYGGSGSGDAAKKDSKTIYDSLSAVGLECNPAMKAFYEGGGSGEGRPSNELMGKTVFGLATGENPNGYDSVRSSYAGYKDAAIVVISRVGGEGFDLPRTMRENYKEDSPAVAGARKADDHYLQLDANEEAMIKEATANFDKVIVVLNTAQPMEIGFAEEDSGYNALKGYDIDASKIDACLWMGLPGTTGVMALGRVLSGTVNPSGHTTDTWATDFRNDPSYKNFGSNNVLNGNRYYIGAEKQDAYYIDYEEGIYVGYKYYETRCATYNGAVTALGEKAYASGEEWYAANVMYPFGYGLSYTDFIWTVKSISRPTGSVVTAEDEIEVVVNVHNNGTASGKDVVQLYYTPPYNSENKATAIEKSAVVLGAFAKTPEIAGGGDAEVTLKLKVSDMKSYDYNDANGNGFKGYELEAGDYGIKIAEDAHAAGLGYTYKVNAGVKFETDEVTDYKVENLFDDVSGGIDTYLSRSDWNGTFPTTPTVDDRQVDAAFIESLIWKKDDAGKPWEAKEMPKTGAPGDVGMYEMIGAAYDNEDWDKLLDRLTAEEMTVLIGTGAFGTAIIESIDKPKTLELDGPSGWSDLMGGAGLKETCFYAAECVMGATWNRELAYKFGRMVGNEALVATSDGTPISGWYAPGVNIHRSPFAGRNWEYYGEDGFLTGELAAQTCLGAKEKGVITYVKHFALNDNETDRDNTGSDTGNKRGLGGLCVWANEQSMRELYFKPFETAVKKGGANGVMSGFNRVGKEWVGGSYRLLTTVLRSEWGFKGVVITDYGVKKYVNTDQMIRAGGDLRLNQSDVSAADANDRTQVSCMRKATKNILYNVANSNVMDVEIDGYRLPVWVVLLICIDAAAVAGLAAWGVAVIVAARKKAAAANGGR